MQASEIFRRRLYTQHIAGARLSRPEAAVAELLAVQSQDYPGAKWSVGQRVEGGTDAEVERAFASGAFLRTHILRPTWHFVAPADIRWLLALTAPRVHALNAYQYRRLGLDAALLARAHQAIERGLRDGQALTRGEIATLLGHLGIDAAGQRLAYIVMHAELEGLICSGAPRGKQQTYALLEERVPPAPPRSRDEALALLALRFFTGHGPAKLADLVWWSSLSTADVRAGLAQAAPNLAREVIDGEEYWFSPTAPSPVAPPEEAYLVPEYDESMVVARGSLAPDLPWTRPPETWSDFFYRPIIIRDQRAGTWRRTLGRSEVLVETNLFATLAPDQQRLLVAAVERYGAYLGLAATLTTAPSPPA